MATQTWTKLQTQIVFIPGTCLKQTSLLYILLFVFFEINSR